MIHHCQRCAVQWDTDPLQPEPCFVCGGEPINGHWVNTEGRAQPRTSSMTWQPTDETAPI